MVAVVGLALLVIAVIAVAGDSGDAEVQLHASMADDGFDLSWNVSPRADHDDVEVQTRERVRVDDHWVTRTGWKPVAAVGDTRTAQFRDVEPGRRYDFRARIFGGRWSEPVQRLFVELTLPVMRIDIDQDAEIFDRKKTYRDASFSLEPNGAPVEAYEAPIRIRGRGNTTWDAVDGKMSYQIKLGAKEGLMGMTPSKHWVLRANFFDRSQLRNWIANRISEATELAWTPDTRWVDVLFNGDYVGIYELSEKIEVAPDKVDIPELDADTRGGDDLTGGYLLEIDRNEDKVGEHDGWTSETGYPVYIKRPKSQDSNDEQRAYIEDHVTKFEKALYGEEFTDPDRGFRRYLDVPSFIDYWIVEELTLDTDAFHWSTYFYKDRDDDKLRFGPAWDYDRALGSPHSRLAPDPEGWFTIHPSIIMGDGTRTWAYQMFQDPTFAVEVRSRWRQALPELRRIPDEILSVAPALEDAKQADLLRWADSTDALTGYRYDAASQQHEADFLAAWLTDRLDWMTGALDAIVETSDFGKPAVIEEF